MTRTSAGGSKLLLVGEAPSQHGSPHEPLAGRIGQRLARLGCVDFAAYLLLTDRVNVFQEWPGSAGKGSAFPREAAAAAALELRQRTDKYQWIMLLGKRVAAAFGMASTPYLTWCDATAGNLFAVVPHPSGVNRWYNDAANSEAARAFLTASFQQARRTQ